MITLRFSHISLGFVVTVEEPVAVNCMVTINDRSAVTVVNLIHATSTSWMLVSVRGGVGKEVIFRSICYKVWYGVVGPGRAL